MSPLWPSTAAEQHCFYEDIRGDLGGEGRGIGIVVDHLVLLQRVAVNIVPAGRPEEIGGLVANQTGLGKKGGGVKSSIEEEDGMIVNSKTATGEKDCVGLESAYHQIVHVAEASIKVLLRSLC